MICFSSTFRSSKFSCQFETVSSKFVRLRPVDTCASCIDNRTLRFLMSARGANRTTCHSCICRTNSRSRETARLAANRHARCLAAHPRAMQARAMRIISCARARARHSIHRVRQWPAERASRQLGNTDEIISQHRTNSFYLSSPIISHFYQNYNIFILFLLLLQEIL